MFLSTRNTVAVCLLALLVLSGLGQRLMAGLPALKVSENRRYLVHEDKTPFFYLGDTAWELFHRLSREEAEKYLANRAALRFTVIQAVSLAEVQGVDAPNAYGHYPLLDRDPARPAVQDGPENDYWDHVDFIVNKANELGMYVGLLPTWGAYWHDGGAIFTPQNAETYGRFLGERYRDAGVIWILGGDRNIDADQQKEIIRAMAAGLRAGDGGRHLITFHPTGRSGSSQWFHDEPWLDFNMRQNGHEVNYDGPYNGTTQDYNRTPVKPVIDGEPLYEGHPISFNPKAHGHSLAADVRRPLYWDLFSGAFGHTYGHHSVWQMWQPGRGEINAPLMPWYDAINEPGASQMQHARALLESRPMLTRIADDSIIVPDRVRTSVPGAGQYRFKATRDEDGTYAMVYAPVGRSFAVRMDTIKGSSVKAWWFDPRTGEATAIGEFENKGEKAFTPPNPGEAIDWILVLDDASRNYPPPGVRGQ